MKTRVFNFADQQWQCAGQPRLMGILNVTPDSFSDGGTHPTCEQAVQHALHMVAEGADVIDIGGESTRPGASPVSAQEEHDRVIPVVAALKNCTNIPLSVDTRNASVAEEALAAGAVIINDVSGLHHDPRMLDLLARTQAGCVIMHMRGSPETMQQQTDYHDLQREIETYFTAALAQAADAGIDTRRFMLDPGIGFGKTCAQNLKLIAATPTWRALGRPILLGPSRKSFIGQLLDIEDPGKREWGTAAAVTAAILYGADLVRVHSVREMREAARIAAAIRDAR